METRNGDAEVLWVRMMGEHEDVDVDADADVDADNPRWMIGSTMGLTVNFPQREPWTGHQNLSRLTKKKTSQ